MLMIVPIRSKSASLSPGHSLVITKSGHCWRVNGKSDLKRDGVKYFRSTEYYSLTGEFARFRDPEQYPKPQGSRAAKALRDDLDEIIHKSHLMGCAVCIPLPLYHTIRTSAPRSVSTFPENVTIAAIESLAETTAELVRQHFTGETVAFICDDSSSSVQVVEAYNRLKQRRPDLDFVFNGLTHQDDKVFPQTTSSRRNGAPRKRTSRGMAGRQ
jgi:hypothetical protein